MLLVSSVTQIDLSITFNEQSIFIISLLKRLSGSIFKLSIYAEGFEEHTSLGLAGIISEFHSKDEACQIPYCKLNCT